MLKRIRALIQNHWKITVYMKSGNYYTFTCKEHNFTKPGMTENSWSYDFTKMHPVYHFDWNEVEAVNVK